ncbi:DUF4920 domain-containing protein [Marinoscillum luteum]|uniref:DUF4920 domain-containing protein n=1 Tax=Marinoscillum luteum TaxID=861051 RepID=A0ABW7N598_9BACT
MNIKKDISRLLSTNWVVLIISGAFFVVGGSSCENKKASWDSFGDPIAPEAAITTDAMLTGVASADSLAVKFEAEITEVCQMKGCWMTLKSADGSPVRVTFKDYGFFVPKDAAGKKVIIEGVALSEVLDEATARHYAEDSGKPFDENADLRQVSVIASGVLIAKEDQL